MFDFDHDLALRYGSYASYTSDISPSLVEYHGENPTDEVDRLLDHYATPECSVLDIGCGTGFTLCRLAPKVTQIWGIDINEELLHAARLRIERLGLTNATVVGGNILDQEVLQRLPDATFHLAFSRRGPNLTASFLRTLRPEAIMVQELVGNHDGYPLKEIFGRRNYSPYSFTSQEALLSHYAEMELFPISYKEYFYEAYYRDADHLIAFLSQAVGAPLSNWRLANMPYDPTRDRAALDLYLRYNTTPKGIRVLHQRKIFVLRRTMVTYYPIDTMPSTRS